MQGYHQLSALLSFWQRLGRCRCVSCGWRTRTHSAGCPALEARARRSAGSAQFGRLSSRPVRGPALAIAGVSAEKRATSRRLLWSSKLLVRCFDSCSLLSSLSGVLCRASPQVKKGRHLASGVQANRPGILEMLQLLGACSADAGRKIAERELQSSHIGIQMRLFPIRSQPASREPSGRGLNFSLQGKRFSRGQTNHHLRPPKG